MPTAGNPRVHIRLNRDLLSQLRERGADVSGTCRRIVEEHLAGTPKPKVKKPARPVTKPQRLRDALALVEALMVDYQGWLDNLPENLSESTLACRLQETVDSLEEARDLLEGIDLPKGFGRD